ncbi:MAG: metalloregulator ArsR/SmtB family transcription factor [Acidobacteriota bacterium]|nr:metalloregulator ArsR/SmtB family transcription factor [Acidobacteriota bacterium]
MKRVHPECVSPDRSPDELTALRRSLAAKARPLRRMADHYSLLAGETRLKIITLLTGSGELCVCDLASVLEMTPAAVSQHLSRLRSGRLVQSRRDGMTIYYRMTEGSDGLPSVRLPDFEPAAEG